MEAGGRNYAPVNSLTPKRVRTRRPKRPCGLSGLRRITKKHPLKGEGDRRKAVEGFGTGESPAHF